VLEDRTSIQELGGDIVLFYNAHPKLVAAWRRQATDVPADIVVVSDPDATLYESLGTKRTNPVTLAAKSAVAGLRAIRAGRMPKATSADMLRLGADVAVRADGTIARLHLADAPEDRVPFRELVSAL
jgi:hypothetical protein